MLKIEKAVFLFQIQVIACLFFTDRNDIIKKRMPPSQDMRKPVLPPQGKQGIDCRQDLRIHCFIHKQWQFLLHLIFLHIIFHFFQSFSYFNKTFQPVEREQIGIKNNKLNPLPDHEKVFLIG